MQGHVTTQIVEKIATIEFYHPAHNSLPSHLLSQLAHAISDVGQNNDVLVVIIKSGGDRTFCAGASFDELVAIEDFDTGKKFFMGFANVINAMRKCPKPIIGRVHGKAVGGGVGLASAMDYCIATQYASIKLSELAVGIGPFVVGPAVERKVGLSAFSQLTLDATNWQTAEWAEQKGMYTSVFDNTEEMDDYINSFAKKLASMNPEAVSMLKKVFWKGTENWDQLLEQRAEMSGKLVLSHFSKNAISGFLKK